MVIIGGTCRCCVGKFKRQASYPAFQEYLQILNVNFQVGDPDPEIPVFPPDDQHRVFSEIFPDPGNDESRSADKKEQQEGYAMPPVEEPQDGRVFRVIQKPGDARHEQTEYQGEGCHAGDDVKQPGPVQPGHTDTDRPDGVVAEPDVLLLQPDKPGADHDLFSMAEMLVHQPGVSFIFST